jgi:AcrR family transcriptional regulator
MQNLLVTSEVLTVSDIARELGISRQALYQREGEKKLPKPDFRTKQGQPLWRRSTLVRKGILEG